VTTAVRATWPRVALLVTIAVFLAVTAWWLAADESVLDFDSGRHLFNTWAMRDALADWDLLAPIAQDNINHYPPLLYLVGAAGMAIGGWQSVDAAMAAMNVVFVPLLAFGCFAAARVAYGDLAGVLAAVFALGTPFVASAFHFYMLDVPQAAMVATTVGLVLLSRRFERVGISAVAGAAGAGAMLLKPTSAIFLSGFLAVAIARGGWRSWRGLAAFLAVGAVLSAPWYIVHADQLRGLTRGAVGGVAGPTVGVSEGVSYIRPRRWSEENFAWYGWNLMNVQLAGPLFLAFLAGAVTAAVRFVKRRNSADYTPELLVGGLVSYLGMTWIELKDARYTLPALVYVAVIAVAWVPALRGRPLKVAAGALVCIALINLLGVATKTGSRIAIKGPGSPPTLLGERSIRLYTPEGFIRSRPRHDGAVLDVMRDARADGVKMMSVDLTGGALFSLNGLQVLMHIAGVPPAPTNSPTDIDPGAVFLLRHAIPPDEPPCAKLDDGFGLYLVEGGGNMVVPFESYDLYCPPKRR
jgi:4-amino-4-deoxy-L-arabinose transferase-like glycosyltransferase